MGKTNVPNPQEGDREVTIAPTAKDVKSSIAQEVDAL